MSLKPPRPWLLSVAVLLASGCALTEVKVQPWEREHLAKPQMQFDTDVLDSGFRDHAYFSKEAATGGKGAGGGGCGCN